MMKLQFIVSTTNTKNFDFLSTLLIGWMIGKLVHCSVNCYCIYWQLVSNNDTRYTFGTSWYIFDASVLGFCSKRVNQNSMCLSQTAQQIPSPYQIYPRSQLLILCLFTYRFNQVKTTTDHLQWFNRTWSTGVSVSSLCIIYWFHLNFYYEPLRLKVKKPI